MTITSQEPGGASRVSSRDSRPPRPQHWRDVESRAQKAYNEWYDGPEVFADVDSLSHEFVREIAPDLIAALHSAASTANAAEARLDGTRRKSEDYELRAKAAEATLAKVRAWAELEGTTSAFLSLQAQQEMFAILNGKTQ